jgi:dUTP pyrophosphatase
MAEVVGKFSKISLEQFIDDYRNVVSPEESEETIAKIYEQITLPERSTQGSAGYDFKLPIPAFFDSNIPFTIPTGIRAEIKPGWFLMLVPRSSLGFKYGMRLRNTAGIIDSDYAFADNEGHIMAKVVFDECCCLNDGDKFMQGIFVPYGITDGDATKGKRTGGFGSTGT